MKNKRLHVLVCLAGLVVPAAVLSAETPALDLLRLDSKIRPLTQRIELELDPAKEGYTGKCHIELQFGVATDRFRFHALEIDLQEGSLDGKPLSFAREEAGIVAAVIPELVAPGVHRFEIGFTNNFNRDGTGLYKTETQGKSYLFTQMEPVDARRAFPCWDEPSFKIPWQLTLTVPKGLTAVANLPAAQTVDLGNRQRVEFGRTPPMSSYLVAFAVGPFDSVSISGQAVPGQIFTVAGKSSMAATAAEEIPAIVQALERYFGLPYPFPKLDHLATPEFNWGAMENAGLITYRDTALLRDSADVTLASRRNLIEIIAHETAHMWFGDLVTMNWWDDLWLNEAFATFMSHKIGAQLRPDLRFDLIRYFSISAARGNDTQPSVKAIRRQFRGGDNLQEAFDALSYQKGCAILSMIEGWIGPTNFQASLRRYFLRHSWGNARASDLWDAFAESGDPTLSETLRRYLEQPGLPELAFTRLGGDQLHVRQHRYRALIATNVAGQTWRVPIMIRYGRAGESQIARLLLEKEEQTFTVPGAGQAEWIYPNAGESGYYSWSLPSDLTAALTNRAVSLSSIERLGLLDTADRAVLSGHLPMVDALRLGLHFAHDPEPEIKSASLGGLMQIRDLIKTNERPACAQLLRKVLRPVLNEVGFGPKTNDTAEIENFRQMLLSTLGSDAEDPDVLAFCREAAARQLADPRSVKKAIAWVTLSVTARFADEQWYQQLRAAFGQATSPDIRARFLGAMNNSLNPEIARSALDYALTDAIKPTEFQGFVYGPRETALARFEWLKRNYDAVKKKMPAERLPFLVSVLWGGDAALMAEGRKFFLDPARRDALTELRLTEVLNWFELETALRAQNEASLIQFIHSMLNDPR